MIHTGENPFAYFTFIQLNSLPFDFVSATFNVVNLTDWVVRIHGVFFNTRGHYSAVVSQLHEKHSVC